MEAQENKIRYVAIWIENLSGDIGRTSGKCTHDMQFFRSITLGRTVLMGRKTFEAMGGPLPKRNNLVVGRDHLHLNQALIEAQKLGHTCYIIGGSELFYQTFHLVDTIYKTILNETGEVVVAAPKIPLEFNLEFKLALGWNSYLYKYVRNRS